MSEMNMFKRKTKVIDDDDNMDIETPEIKRNIIQNINGNQSIKKIPDENKSDLNHSHQVKQTISENTEKSSSYKKDLNQINKSTAQENLNKMKSSITQETQKKSSDKNNLNLDKQQTPIDKIKKAIQISGTSNIKKSVTVVKDVRINKFIIF
jgi:hypothetical protein